MLNASADWLSIRQASRLLGVHIGTVREWTDEGLLPSYRTPGGHRRFSKSDLEKFLAQRRKSSNAENNANAQTLARLRDELRASPHSDWLKNATVHLDESARTRQREFGQRLLACVVAFADEPNARERLLDDGRQIARAYGHALIESGISAGSAARATIHFRQLILKAVLDVHLGARTGDEEDARLFQRVSSFLDEILFAIVEVYP
ncbi:MAG: helix-turn-helix domain-containing protein [Chloroflexota bacterium]